MRAPWAGNVRELENCIERAIALSDGHEIRAGDILLSSDEGQRGSASLKELIVRMALEQHTSLKTLSESYIDAALEVTNGRKSEAAKLLDVNRRTLYRREERLGRADRA